jgi:hypothetical protein
LAAFLFDVGGDEALKRKPQTFETGATRDSGEGKYEYARFFDSRVVKSDAAFMHKHRLQVDGTLRDPDNWKRGIPIQNYMDGLARHFQDLWELHQHGSATRPETGESVDLIETLAAIRFNCMGWMFEVLKAKDVPQPQLFSLQAVRISKCGVQDMCPMDCEECLNERRISSSDATSF